MILLQSVGTVQRPKCRAFQAAKSSSRRVAARAVAAPVAALDVAARRELMGYMMKKLGWEESWADTITSEMRKRGMPASVHSVQAAFDYLTSVGFTSAEVCNMASICKDILILDPASQLQPVVEYVQRQGVTGRNLLRLLEVNPTLLTYAVSADGRVLEKGRTRAAVEVRGSGERAAGVSFWREGAAFETAPVAPLKPLSV